MNVLVPWKYKTSGNTKNLTTPSPKQKPKLLTWSSFQMGLSINGHSYELLILVSSLTKSKPAQQCNFPGKQARFLSSPEQPSPKCSSLQPTALMDAALLSFPGDSSQHYSSFSRSNQNSRASSCCRLVYSLLWSNTGVTFSSPHPHFLRHFFFFDQRSMLEGLDIWF